MRYIRYIRASPLSQEEEDQVRGKAEAARAAQHKAEQLQTQLEADGSRVQRAQQALEAERAKLQARLLPYCALRQRGR